MVDISVLTGFINQLITGGAPPCMYPLVIKHGWLENPRTEWRFIRRKITDFYIPFSSQPSLNTGGYDMHNNSCHIFLYPIQFACIYTVQHIIYTSLFICNGPCSIVCVRTYFNEHVTISQMSLHCFKKCSKFIHISNVFYRICQWHFLSKPR